MIVDLGKYYLYRYIRLDKNEPFYIGIGKTKNYKRAYEKYKCDRSLFWFKITEKTNYRIDILLDNLTKQEAVKKEIEFIKLYGRKNLKTGSLVNLTDGGDGVNNIKWSEDSKNKLRLKMLGKNNHQFGKKQSQETKDKRIKSLTGKKRTNEQKRNQSLKNTQSKAVEVFSFISNEKIG